MSLQWQIAGKTLLKGLLHLGCVEISQPEDVLSDPQWAALFRRETSELAQRKSADYGRQHGAGGHQSICQAEKWHVPQAAPRVGGGIPERLGTAEAAQTACDAVRGQLAALLQAQSEADRLDLSVLHRSQPWQDLDVPLETEGTAHTVCAPGGVPRADGRGR